MTNPRSLLTVYHSFFKKVTENTTVYFVGTSIKGLVHQCSSGLMTRDIKMRSLQMDKPHHIAVPACYCDVCDKLYIAKENNNG